MERIYGRRYGNAPRSRNGRSTPPDPSLQPRLKPKTEWYVPIDFKLKEEKIMSQEVKMKEKFEIIDFFDKARWQSDCEDALINYAYPNNLTSDEKLLTHWLSYIMDRQMSFEQIWDKGGFIISEIVHKYTHEQNMDFLKNLNEFFIRTGDLGYTFTSKIEYRDFSDKQKDRIKLYYKKESLRDDFKITFKSRFYTDDFVCILHTLYTLKQFNCSFVEYLSCVSQVLCCLPGHNEIC